MKVLISLLGLSPGVVTGAYYALYHGWGVEQPVPVDRVVTLGTSAPGMDRLEDEIAREFDRWERETGARVTYDDTCRLRITGEDLNDKADLDEFESLLIRLLDEEHRADEVYLVVAGGRKSMAALAAIAVQLFGHGVQGMYHLYVDEDLERDGTGERFWMDLQRRRQVMRPPEGGCHLVQVPFIYIREDGRLRFQGDVDSSDRARALEARFEVLDERGREKYWSHDFEVKTAEYVREHKKYPNSIPNYRHPDLPSACKELDVYAEFSHDCFEKRLVVECKLRVIPDPGSKPVDVGAVRQVIDRLAALEAAYREKPHLGESLGDKELRLEGWVVCNANAATPEAWARAREAGVQLFWAELPRDWQTGPRDWKIARLAPISEPRVDSLC